MTINQYKVEGRDDRGRFIKSHTAYKDSPGPPTRIKLTPVDLADSQEQGGLVGLIDRLKSAAPTAYLPEVRVNLEHLVLVPLRAPALYFRRPFSRSRQFLN